MNATWNAGGDVITAESSGEKEHCHCIKSLPCSHDQHHTVVAAAECLTGAGSFEPVNPSATQAARTNARNVGLGLSGFLRMERMPGIMV